MGYPNFGKVKTIVLPVPTQDLTFDEYQRAFGIDLQSINLHDQIMFRKDGIVYPSLYVDAGNGVIQTAIGNFDISNGFEIDSETLIQVQAKELIESGQIDNAKPIYCHPVSIRVALGAQHGEEPRLICLIFNTKSVAYTKDTFLSEMLTFNGRVSFNGLFNDTGNSVKIISSYASVSEGKINIFGNNLSTGAAVTPNANSVTLNDLLTQSGISFSDDVNKIN